MEYYFYLIVGIFTAILSLIIVAERASIFSGKFYFFNLITIELEENYQILIIFLYFIFGFYANYAAYFYIFEFNRVFRPNLFINRVKLHGTFIDTFLNNNNRITMITIGYIIFMSEALD